MLIFSKFCFIPLVFFYILVSVNVKAQTVTLNATSDGTRLQAVAIAAGTGQFNCGSTFTDGAGNYATAAGDGQYVITLCAPAGQYLSVTFSQVDVVSGGAGNTDTLFYNNGLGLTMIPEIGGGGQPASFNLTGNTGGCISFTLRTGLTGSNVGFTATIACITPPTFDEPCGATPLTVSSTGTCTPIVFNTSNSSVSRGMFEPGCDGFGAGQRDVWFSAVVPASGVIDFVGTPLAIASDFFITAMTIYTGTCSNLRHSGCTPAVISSTTPTIANYVGTPGETIYLRVWDSYSSPNNSMQICASTIVATPGQVQAGTANTVTCGSSVTFTDPGGSGNYSNNQSATYTICPGTAGQFVSVNFASFNLENNIDFLNVMNGSSSDAPFIRALTGSTNPGVITSSAPDGCLTFSFVSNSSIVSSGWSATVSCSPTAGTNAIICSGANCNNECGMWICIDGAYPTENAVTAGVRDLNVATRGCNISGEISTQWYYFKTLTAGSLGLTFSGPSGQDYDFAIYGPTTDSRIPCPSSTGESPIRCSFSGQNGNTGLGNGATDFYEGAEGDGFVAPLNVQAGETYALMMNIFQNGGPQPVITMDITGTGTLDCSILDVELSNFNGVNQGAKNLLYWTTASESNNDYFILERSLSAELWEEVGTVSGAGTSSLSHYYQLADTKPFFPLSYYRIKQVDFDGSYSYSKIISIAGDIVQTSMISDMYPNPTSDYFSFRFDGNVGEPLLIEISNELGQKILEKTIELPYPGSTYNIETNLLSEGFYFVSFSQGAVRKNQRLQKM